MVYFKLVNMRTVLLTFSLVLSGIIHAQKPGRSADDSVRLVISQLFTAMQSADGELFRSVMADSAVMQTIITGPGRETLLRSESVQAFAGFIANLKKGVADERIRFASVQIDGDLASVWTPYQFFYNGAFSHCGVNHFVLVRYSNGWKIQYLIDTRRKTGCE